MRCHTLTPDDVVIEDIQQPQVDDEVPNNEPLRRSQRIRKSAIPDEYFTYMGEEMNE